MTVRTAYKVRLAHEQVTRLQAWFQPSYPFVHPQVERWARKHLGRVRSHPAKGTVFSFNDRALPAAIADEILHLKKTGRVRPYDQTRATTIRYAFASPQDTIEAPRVRGPVIVTFPGGEYFIGEDGSIETRLNPS